MLKALALILLLLTALPVLSFAQADDNDPAIEDDWDIYTADGYTRGDQTFNISFGVVFPTVFINNGNVIPHNFSPPVGGTGSLSYNYFFSRNIFIGGEISGIFITTVGKNTAFFIPLGARVGYQFYIWRFEIPVSATIGMAWHRFLNLSHYSIYLKGGAALYYRFNTNWSFGLNFNWLWLPEWTEVKSKDGHANFLELTLAARYHF